MSQTLRRLLVIASVVMAVIAGRASAADAKTTYEKMAPLDEYLITDRNAEIALARSAAPESISRDAEILALGRTGFATAVKGTNGFVCLVQRSWAAGTDDPEFWNPKLRAPICLNAAAAESFLPHIIKKTDWVLAGLSKTQIADKINAAFDSKELQSPQPGAMCYMMSKQGYVSDRGGHWLPHLMFFVPATDPAAWGANMTGSPLLAAKDPTERLTIFLLPVGKWSDGTAAQ